VSALNEWCSILISAADPRSVHYAPRYVSIIARDRAEGVDEPTSTFGQLVFKSVDGVCSWNNSDLQASFILAGQKEVRDLHGLRSLANSSTVDASACLRGGNGGRMITPEQIGRESF
jgi:hypothetical protein